MTFGDYLKECIEKKEVQVATLARSVGLNRGKLYNVFYGERSLTETELFSLIETAGFTPNEAQKLVDLYFTEIFGKTEFAKIKVLEKIIQTDVHACSGFNRKTFSDDVEGSIECKSQLLNAVSYIFGHEKTVISNFSFDNKELDALVFDCVINSDVGFTHITELSETPSAAENIASVACALKYMYNNSFPVYRYTDTEHATKSGLFPYYFVGETHAILFNSVNGIFIRDKASVAKIRENAVADAADCAPLGIKTDDVVYHSSLYDTALKNENISLYVISFYPCVATCSDYDIIYSLARDDLPEKEGLVNIAYEHYSRFYTMPEHCSIVSKAGIESFAETGNIQEIPNKFVKSANKETRIKILQKMLEKIESGEIYIADDSKIKLQPEFSLESFCTDLMLFFGYDFKKSDFFVADKYLCALYDISFVNTVKNLTQYLIHSKKVYPKEFSKTFIKNLISKLEFFPEYGS